MAKLPCSGTPSRQAVALQTFTWVTNEFLLRYNSAPGVEAVSPWGVSGYLLTSSICRGQPSAPEEGHKHLPFLVSRRLIRLNLLAGSAEHSPALGFLEWSKWSFLLLAYSWRKWTRVRKCCLHPCTSKSTREGFHVCLKQFLSPLKTPQQGQLEELPVMLQSCGMNHCYPPQAKRAFWVHLLGEFLPRSPYLAPAVPWPAAPWQIHVTACWHSACPALLFGRCMVLMFITFARLVLVPPY